MQLNRVRQHCALRSDAIIRRARAPDPMSSEHSVESKWTAHCRLSPIDIQFQSNLQLPFYSHGYFSPFFPKSIFPLSAMIFSRTLWSVNKILRSISEDGRANLLQSLRIILTARSSRNYYKIFL